jgi:hypothetical protein
MLEQVYGKEVASKAVWNSKGGCGCGCSPCFILVGRLPSGKGVSFISAKKV